MSNEMLDQLEAINANANRLVGTITAEQWELPTPCTEWNVRQLVNHMAGTSRTFAASAARTEPAQVEDHLGDDPTTAFKAAIEANGEAWRADGAIDGMVSIPAEMPAGAAVGINILDTGTHTWDLATAIGADHGLSQELVALIDGLNRQTIDDQIRSYAGFGEDLPVADDADPLTRMLGFVGRRP